MRSIIKRISQILAYPFLDTSLYEKQDDKVKQEWLEILEDESFMAAGWYEESGMYILSHSLKKENSFQLSHIDTNGSPLSDIQFIKGDIEKLNCTGIISYLPYGNERGKKTIFVIYE